MSRMRLHLLSVTFLVLAAATAAPAAAQDAATERRVADRYAESAKRLIDAALADSAAYARLTYLTDTFGPRLSGSEQLEDAIDWILTAMVEDGLENVRGEPVMVPHWVRGEERLTLLAPRRASLRVLGLGGSVGTPAAGLEADVLVVRSFEELSARAGEARGRIVLYNVPFASYGETVAYRVNGAVHASRAGAVASLVRSVGHVGLNTPHTGMLRYRDGVPPIPHAAVSAEDAMMLQRMQDRGQRVAVRLLMEAKTLPDARSRNVVAELVGRERPDEIVVLGGHIDSWDVGQGALDDAGGCVAAWEAVRLMKRLGLRPRRTVRVVLWTNEENGLRGGTAYRDRHVDEIDDHVLAMESDAGVFAPTGFGFSGTERALAILREVGALLAPVGADRVTAGGGGADIGPLMREGVPGMGLAVAGDDYFLYHHTDADTADKVDPHDLNLCTAAMAVMAYVVAEMPERLPRRRATVTN